MRRLLRGLALFLGLFLPAGQPPQAREEAVDVKDVCTLAILEAEKAQDIPDRLLLAVAMAESGRWDVQSQRSYAWPWTVTSGGAGTFLDDRAKAIQRVVELRAAGQTNIDVGCMQVNLRAHPNAFPDLTAAFDPVRNAAYAARFLRQLFEETGDWSKAVAYYHSRTPAKGSAYRDRVYARLETLAPADQLSLAARQPLAPLSPADKVLARKVMTIWRWLREGQRSSLVAQAHAAANAATERKPAGPPGARGAPGGIAIGPILGLPSGTLAAN